MFLMKPNQFNWHCEPPEWANSDTGLYIRTGKDTDFWQDTFYDFCRDDGHFLGRPIEKDFTAYLGFCGEYETLYDQAGLMLRYDKGNWLKAGIEYSDGATNFSVVVTRDHQSDWSIVRLPKTPAQQRLRLTLVQGAVLVNYMDTDGFWRIMRLANFPMRPGLHIGPFACSPQRTGFEVTFNEFKLDPPIANPLHGD